MFFKVWNADKAQWIMGGTRMCKSAANRIADAIEARTGDSCCLVRA